MTNPYLKRSNPSRAKAWGASRGRTQDGPLRAFIYDRNSRDSKKTRTAVQDQDVENRRFCDQQGWTIAGVFVDPGKSASRYTTVKRTDYELMIEGVRAGQCDVLVVWESSRLSRDTRVFLDLRDLCEATGVLLCYNGKVYDMSRSDDRHSTLQDAVNDERDADKIRDRNLRTVRLNAERGRPHGPLPYGYRRLYDETTGALVEQVPYEPEATVVREIAERIAAAQSARSIAADLNSRGVPAPRSARWTPDALVKLVTKPTYVGERVFRNEVIGKAKWEPILDQPVFLECVRILSDPARLTHRDSTIKHLLSGLAFCFCGHVLRSRRVDPRWVYRCHGCYGSQLEIPAFDAIVSEAVLGRVETEDFAVSLVPPPEDDLSGVALARAAMFEAQLAQARALSVRVVDGRLGLSAASLAAMEQELLPLIEAARATAVSAAVPGILLRIAGPGARGVWEGWTEEGDVLSKRAVIRAVVRPSLNRAGKGRRGVTPDRYDLDWIR